MYRWQSRERSRAREQKTDRDEYDFVVNYREYFSGPDVEDPHWQRIRDQSQHMDEESQHDHLVCAIDLQ